MATNSDELTFGGVPLGEMQQPGPELTFGGQQQVPELSFSGESLDISQDQRDKNFLEKFMDFQNNTWLAARVGHQAIFGAPTPPDDEQMQQSIEFLRGFTNAIQAAPPTDRAKRIAGQTIERGLGQPVSAVLEQAGTLYTALSGQDPDNNTAVRLGRVLREGTMPKEFGQPDIIDNFTEGLASTLGFFIPGKLLANTTGGATAIAAWLGSAVGGQMGREDAQAHGATPEQVEVAYYLNSVFGLSEAASLGLIYKRLDDLTGGVLSKSVKNKLANEALAVGRVAIKGALEEGLQEGFQTVGENLVASDLAGYDPGRSLGANLFEAAATGASVGFTLNLFAGMLGVRNRRAFDRDIQERVLDPVGAKSLSEIGGPLTILSDQYFDVQRHRSQLETELEQLAQRDPELEATASAAVESAEEAAGPLRDVSTAPEAIITFQSNKEVNDRIPFQHTRSVREERMAAAAPVVNKELEGDIDLATRIERTPVTMAITQRLQENAAAKAGVIQELERLQTQEKLSGADKVYKIVLEKKLAEYEFIEKTERQIAKDIKSLTASLLPLMPKGTKLFINNYDVLVEGNEGAAFGWTLPSGTEVSGISLNTKRYLMAAMNAHRNPEDARKIQDAEDTKNELFATLMHEIGHVIAFRGYANLAQKVNTGVATEKETTLWHAIANDYMRFLRDNLNAPIGQSLSQTFTAPHFAKAIQDLSGVRANSIPIDSAVELSQILDQRVISENLSGQTLNYLFSMNEYFAEEFAKIALDSDLVDPNVAPFLREHQGKIDEALKKHKGKFRSTSPAMQNFWKQHSLRGQLSTAIENMTKAVESDPMTALAKDGIMDQETFRRLTPESDRFNWFMDVGFNILQIAQLNPHIKGLQDYTKTLRNWKNDVNNNLAIANDRLTEWKNLGAEQNELLGRILVDETLGRTFDGKWLKEPTEFSDEEIAKYGLKEPALELRAKIKEDFKRVLDQMEAVLVTAKEEIFADDAMLRATEVGKVRREFAELRKRPYFPLMRFGEYVLQVRARGDQTYEGQNYKDGDIIEFQAFDSKGQRNREIRNLKRSMGQQKFSFSSSKMVTPNFSLQGMPLTLLEHLEGKLTSTDISEGVREAIKAVKNDVLPFKSFRKQFQKRKKIMGFSMDAQRAYANYMTSFSNHIARVRWDSVFKEALDSVEDTIKIANRTPDADTTKRAEILNHMNDHLNYVMNPVNELVGLRSAAFFWFLGFNVKSAFVNMTQVPLVTYPYLAARFGDGKAVAQLTRANKTAIQSFTKPDSLDSNMAEMIERGLNESWLDESLATELAMAASEPNLEQTIPRKVREKLWLKVSHYGSLPFHAVEKFNRHVTAIAAYRLAVADGRSHEGAIEEARRAVEKTQFEYARWARPRFQRGKVGGTVFVFQNYLQNALFFALGGDAGAFRMLLMLLLIAGLQGLPFGDNIMDLFDAGATVLKRKTGVQDPHTQIRTDLRRLLKEMDVDPDLVLHGLSSSSFGFSNIGEFMGWPIPDLDLSGSLSMGRIVPGTEMLQPGQERTFERTLAQASERAGGAIVSGAAGIGQALFDKHPDQWKRWEKAMPAAMRQISKAARIRVRGEEATRAGYQIAGFDMHDPQDQGELIAQSLGFTPRDVSRGWEGFIAKQQAVIYYETWKNSVLRHWNFAHETGDQEAVKKYNAEIRKYNRSVPFPEMKIGPETRSRSYETYLRTRKFNASGIEQSRRDRRLSSSIQEIFEEDDN